jgi:ankyrin repeat protein
MIRPDVLATERPYGRWGSRGCDVWETFLAAEAGDAPALRRLLERDPRLARAEYWYTRPIHFAAREGRLEATRILLEAGGGTASTVVNEDLVPVARDRGFEDVARLVEEFRARAAREASDGAPEPEPPASRLGTALHEAARAGDRALVEKLLGEGADPNFEVDSAGSATYAAKTPGIRALLEARGGRLNAFDLVWLGEDDEVVRRVAADPAAAHSGCGGVFTAACKLGKRDLLVRLLEAGARVPPVLTFCRSYLTSAPETLRLLLASGMSPDLPNWQRATLLHALCGRDYRGRPQEHRIECAGLLLDAGAALSPRDEDYRSTPLAWAARSGLPDMVELLLARGAPANLPDDPPWATPLAWAKRRGHGAVVDALTRAGATA